jgi:predicted CoA-binding protein
MKNGLRFTSRCSAKTRREILNMTQNDSIAQVKALLDPASIAIIGASDRNGSWAKRVYRTLKRGGYKGAIYPVNPRSETVWDQKCYPDLASLPGKPDHVVVLVPGAGAIEVLASDTREIQVVLDPLKLTAAALTVKDVSDALKEQRQSVLDLTTSYQSLLGEVGKPAATFVDAVGTGRFKTWEKELRVWLPEANPIVIGQKWNEKKKRPEIFHAR